MSMNFTRDMLEGSLPIYGGDLTIRTLVRSDMDLLSKWPEYPWPYDVFCFSFSGQDVEELDRVYKLRICDKDRITLIVDAGKELAIGCLSLLQIDWIERISGNMSLRIHPEFCEMGIGTRILISVRDWWFGHDMNALRLDVAATNHRAERCYIKAGFQKTGTFWKDAPDLMNKDLNEAKYHFLENYVDRRSIPPRILFYWMEAKHS